MIHIKDKNRQETKQILNSIYRDVYNKKDADGNKISFSEFKKMLENMSEKELQNIFYDFDKKSIEDITKLMINDLSNLYSACKYFSMKEDDENEKQCIKAIKTLIEYEYISEVSDKTFAVGKSIYKNIKNKDLKEFIDKEVLNNE